MPEERSDFELHSEKVSKTSTNTSQSPGGDNLGFNTNVEKNGQIPGSESEPVRWEYFTFETVLPDFTTIATDPSGPQPPNVKSFDNPFEWSSTRKNTILFLSCVSTFLAAYGAGVYGFTQITLRPAWGLGQATFQTGLTTFGLGFAIAPMFLAPFTEINGRRPVFLLSGLLYLVATIGCATTETFAGMLVARFFAGVGSSTYSTIIGGIISDIYHAKDRNTPMAIYAGFAIGGTGIAPMMSGIIVDRVEWRWVFWSHAIAIGILLCFQFFLFKETRGSVLLSRRANAINQFYDQLDEHASRQGQRDVGSTPSNGIRYKVLADEQRASIGRMLYLSLTTPFKLLATEPVVFFFSLWAAFTWGVLYMTFNVLPLVFSTRHNFNTTQQAAVFSAIVIGSIIATTISIYHERLATRHFPKMSSTVNPEGRLYFTCLEAALLPIGLFWFGWTTSPEIHWIVPVLAIGVATIGVYSVYLAVFNYLADVYHRYASSALAGQSFCRNVLGAVFPLFTSQMFVRLGYPGAASLLGGVGALLTLVPWVLVWNGEAIRARSKVAREIMTTT